MLSPTIFLKHTILFFIRPSITFGDFLAHTPQVTQRTALSLFIVSHGSVTYRNREEQKGNERIICI